jgi:hypothetical protein
MIVSLICIFLLAIAVFFLLKSGPNTFVFEFMREVVGEKRAPQANEATPSKDVHHAGDK